MDPSWLMNILTGAGSMFNPMGSAAAAPNLQPIPKAPIGADMMGPGSPSWMDPSLMMEFGRNPDAVAGAAVKAGIAPPALPTGPSLGESLEPPATVNHMSQGIPLPRPRPEAAGGSQYNATVNSAANAAAGKNPMLDALKGLKAPVPPAQQKVSTPNPLPIKTGDIKGGELLALLASLGMGGGAGAGGMKLPQTLGAALGGR